MTSGLNNLTRYTMGGVLLGSLMIAGLTVHRQPRFWHMLTSPLHLPPAAAQQQQQQPLTRLPSARSAADSSSNTARVDADALALYHRTLRAQHTVPISARVRASRPDIPTDKPYRIELLEGPNGCYRMTYLAPKPVQGRVLLSDGKIAYQYEPGRNVVMRRVLPSNIPISALNEAAGWNTEDLLPDLPVRLQRTSTQDARVDGRRVDILVLQLQTKPGGNFVLRERRWVDRETGRSLRIERYDFNGILRRRIELSRVTVTPKMVASTFQPRFPATATVMNVAAARSDNAVALAQTLDLPSQAAGFHIRSAIASRALNQEVVAPMVSGGGNHTAASNHHLLYSDGLRSVSVFVSPLPPDKRPTTLQPTAGWEVVPPDQDTTNTDLLARVDMPRGRVAVAWLREGRRYVAVSRMPLPSLVSVVRAMNDR